MPCGHTICVIRLLLTCSLRQDTTTDPATRALQPLGNGTITGCGGEPGVTVAVSRLTFEPTAFAIKPTRCYLPG
jgi:hypothetical protein